MAGPVHEDKQPTESTTPNRRRKYWYLLALPALAFLLVWSLNYLLVGRVVQTKLNQDPRNRVYSLKAHYANYVQTSTLVLDLQKLDNAAPVDVFRALFQSAEALHASGRSFDRVVLARDGVSVFIIKGEDFSRIGAEFGANQNPVYLIRTLPEKLYRPTGEAAFGRWEGGMLGVLGKQIEDANEAARQWAGR